MNTACTECGPYPGAIEQEGGRVVCLGCGRVLLYPQPQQEKLYLVCTTCGEAFDALEPAREHELQCECVYTILPESEAM